jgi:hypothetical protein
VKRWGKSPPHLWQHEWHGKPRLEQGQICGEGVHPDQDTAGRLLEDMGDRVRREMIVRIALAIRQNPAYRLSAYTMNGLRRNIIGGCSVCAKSTEGNT